MAAIDSLIACGELLANCFVVADMDRKDQPAIYVNSLFTKTTGFHQQEVLGNNLRFLQGPQTSADAKARLRSALAKQIAIHQDMINYKKDGSPFWNRMVLVPFLDESHLFYFGMQMDVTARKNDLIGVDISKLNNTQIEHHEICHHIRNPLTTLVGGRELATNGNWAVSSPQILSTYMAKAVNDIARYVMELRWSPSSMHSGTDI